MNLFRRLFFGDTETAATEHPAAIELKKKLETAGYTIIREIVIEPLQLSNVRKWEARSILDLNKLPTGSFFQIETVHQEGKYVGKKIDKKRVAVWRQAYEKSPAQGLLLEIDALSPDGIIQIGQQTILPYFKENDSPLPIEIDGNTVYPIDITDGVSPSPGTYGDSQGLQWLDYVEQLRIGVTEDSVDEM